MKKKFLSILIFVLGMFGLVQNVTAASAPSTIKTTGITQVKSYVSGVPTVYVKNTANGISIYCEESNKKFPRNSTMTLSREAHQGFVYIIDNEPNTGNSTVDYYIMQTAVWWFKDLVGGTSNLSSSAKNNIINSYNSNSVSRAIYDLVSGAKAYSQTSGSISLSGNTKFTISNGNYVSGKITISKRNVKSVNLKLVGAPSGAQIINKTSNSFQVSVPVSSVAAGSTVNFKVEASGVYYTYHAYEYFYDSSHQYVLLGELYSESHSVDDDISFSITKEEEKHNKLTIYKVDESGNYVKNAKLALYKGDCTNTTCASTNLYKSWTTDANYKYFDDVPVGTYTLVEESAPKGYLIANKQKVNITAQDGTYKVTMVDKKIAKVRISKTDITGTNELAGATLVLKDSTGKEIDKWVSTTTAHYVELKPGEYTLTETIAPKGYKLSETVITFKVDENNNIYEKVNGTFNKVDYIKMVNELKDKKSIKINKLDSETKEYVSGAILMIKNSKGETVATITTTNSASYIVLEEGEYVLSEEAAPSGYELTTEKIYFSVDDEGNIKIKNNGEYVDAVSLTVYNKKEEPEIIIVPKTGLTSTLTYIAGGIILAGGAAVLIKNGKEN